MNVRELPEVKKIIKEWSEEVDKIEPLNVPINYLNNSLNKPYFDLEHKYKQKIREAIEKYDGVLK